MEFTHEQISEIISEITNGEQGLQGLGKQGFESLMLSERSLHNCSHQDVSNGYRDRRVCHEAQTLSHHSTLDDHNNRRQINNEINLGLFFPIYSDFGFYTVRPVRLDRSAKAFVDFIGSSPARKNKIFCFSLAYSKNSLTGGTPHCAKKLYVTFPSDTTDRTFGKPNRTLVPAPMVLRHKTLHLTAELTGKENTTRNLQ